MSSEHADSVPLAITLLIAIGCTQLGFALFQMGLCRAKNAAHALAMNILGMTGGTLGFFIAGYALLAGSNSLVLHHANSATFARFALMLGRFILIPPIVMSALAERWRVKSSTCFAFLACVLTPLLGGWVWCGGWLATIGQRLDPIAGIVDYAGAAVIHLQAGCIALVGVILIGPRLGKYDLRGRPRPILGHHVPFAVAGSMLTTLGLIAVNLSSSIYVADGRANLILTNSFLSITGSTLAALVVLSKNHGKPDPTVICNAVIAGAVASSATCATVPPWAALMTGIVTAIGTTYVIFFLDGRLDDPVGTIAVHAVGGLVGALAVGSFLGDRQMIAQLLLIGVTLAWSLVIGYVLFQIVTLLTGKQRPSREAESSGLDVSEIGITAYPEFLSPPRSEGLPTEPRPATLPQVGGQRRYSIVVEGVDSNSLIQIWSRLCQVRQIPPTDDFKEVYRFVTTITGNRFRFSGGDPSRLTQNLRELLQSEMPEKPVHTRIES